MRLIDGTPEEIAAYELARSVCRILHNDGYVDIPVPAQGATAEWAILAAIQVPGFGHGAFVLVDPEAKMALRASSLVRPGRTYVAFEVMA